MTVEVGQGAALSGPLDPRVRGTRQRRGARARLRAAAQNGRARVNIACGVTIGTTTQPFPTLSRTDVTIDPATPLDIETPLTLDLAFPIPSGDLRIGCTGTSADAGVTVNFTGGEATFPLASTIPVASTCTPSANVICAEGIAIWSTATNAGGQTVDGRVNPRDLYNDGGGYWYFNEANVDLFVQVVNRCQFENRYWVFLSGLTDARHAFTVSATNPATGVTRTYESPLGDRFTRIDDREGIPCR